MRKTKQLLPQLNLFEDIVLIEKLRPGDRFRMDLRSIEIYVVSQQHTNNNETTIRLFRSSTSYLVKHGRRVFRIITGNSKTE